MAEWHVRRQRPEPKTTLIWFIDRDANRMTYLQFLDALDRDEAFRALFIQVLAEADQKLYVWETPSISRNTAVGELEMAITEVPPPPKRFRVDPKKYRQEFANSDELAVTLTEGDATLVIPSPREAEGWYADIGIFVRRIRPAQVHALWQTFAREVKKAIGTERIWLSSNMPGAPWLHLKIEKNNKSRAYSRYGR